MVPPPQMLKDIEDFVLPLYAGAVNVFTYLPPTVDELKSSIEAWRYLAKDMTQKGRKRFFHKWINGIFPDDVHHSFFDFIHPFFVLKENAKNDRSKKNKWSAAVKVFYSAVKDLIE